MFSKSCAVLILSTIGIMCLFWPQFFCSDKISRGHCKCFLAIVVLAFGPGHLAQTKVLTFDLQAHADALQVCVVNFIPMFLLVVLSVITR